MSFSFWGAGVSSAPMDQRESFTAQGVTVHGLSAVMVPDRSCGERRPSYDDFVRRAKERGLGRTDEAVLFRAWNDIPTVAYRSVYLEHAFEYVEAFAPSALPPPPLPSPHGEGRLDGSKFLAQEEEEERDADLIRGQIG